MLNILLKLTTSMTNTLLSRLQGSYTVQEQEAAEYIEKLENSLVLIRGLLNGDLFFSIETIVNLIDGVLDE